MAFNVLTDPWIPLDDPARLASYVDLLTGARDAPDLIHPRDDCRFFARMLLSALTQALFPAADATELRTRIETPLDREVVRRRVDEVAADFELVGGEEPWMQSPAPASTGAANETSSLFLDVAKHLLFRPAVQPDALCAPCAVPMIYGLQAFVPKGGRGYSPSVRGAPPTTTLIVSPESVRKSSWASTLHSQAAACIVYGDDAERPWRCHAAERDGGTIGLVEGLFWKPRALRLIETAADACASCGRGSAVLFAVKGFAARQRRTGGIYRHPMTPCVRVRVSKSATELRFAKLHSDRPAWTALADWIGAALGDAEDGLPAPIVAQWTDELARPMQSTSLLVLDYGTRDASVLHRFVESFPLSLRLTDRDVIAAVRARVAAAEEALKVLKTACVRLHMKTRPRDRLGKAQNARFHKESERVHDVVAAFWQRTEPAFWQAYEAAVGEDPAAQLAAELSFGEAIKRAAINLFDAQAEPSISDPSRVAVIAEVRSALRKALAEQAGRA